MRLIDDLAVVLMTIVAQLCWRLDQQVRVGSGMWNVTINALTFGERLVRVFHSRSRSLYLLPVALAAHLIYFAP